MSLAPAEISKADKIVLFGENEFERPCWDRSNDNKRTRVLLAVRERAKSARHTPE